ncbi:hypothetical protein B0H17DRAFT_1134043 [Mycena rosella]|uniref:Uncharacterized protein n=1 Tax=Mycena rosella TaxID=1033263 RepID=A0AAD7DIJ9_MYCRO|nr:hypothetical protein B0H17DRAFT_1134043 [Mycena rosella]
MPGISPLSLSPEQFQELLQLATDAKTTSYFAVAALTFLLKWTESAATTTSSQSVMSINTTGKNGTAPVATVFQTDKLEGVTTTLIVATVDLILLLRQHTLRWDNKLMLFSTVEISSIQIDRLPDHVNNLLVAVPKYFTLYPAPSLVVVPTRLKAFTMFVMTVHHCKSRLGASSYLRNAMPIVTLFLRDGIYWFLAAVAVNPPQIIMWASVYCVSVKSVPAQDCNAK